MSLIDSPILVLGHSGQVAQALQTLLRPIDNKNLPHYPASIFLNREKADFTNPNAVIDQLEKLQPGIIINTVAYTTVDKAESEPQIADLVNHTTPAAIAAWVAQNNKTLVHYSTDYVYEGTGDKPRAEEASTGPLSVYGQTKLAGDVAIQQSGARALILRTSWVYSHQGKNFFRTMLKLGAEREELNIVNDQVGSPTYAPDLAAMTLQILNHTGFQQQLKGTDIYHVCGSGYASWFDFATEIFRLASQFHHPLKVKRIHPILSVQYPTPAQRPLNSRLDQSKLQNNFNLTMPHWKNSLVQAFQNLDHSS